MSAITSLVVFGATGTQGHPVVDAALKAGLSVRAVSRDIVKAEESHSDRVECCQADLLEADSVAAAMAGMDAAFFYLPVLPQSAEADAMLDNVIAGAGTARLQRLVFTASSWCGEAMPSSPFVDAVRTASQRVLDCGVDAVVLRPTLYLANLVWPHIIREIQDQGQLTYPPLDGQRRLNWTATEDQARLAVAVLNADAVGEIIDVASPEAVNGPELCRLLARIYGREVHYAPQSIADFAETLSRMADSAEVGRSIAALYEGINRLPEDGPLVDTRALEQRFDLRLTPVSEWIEQRLGALLDRYGRAI